jgi:hypothetical protein
MEFSTDSSLPLAKLFHPTLVELDAMDSAHAEELASAHLLVTTTICAQTNNALPISTEMDASTLLLLATTETTARLELVTLPPDALIPILFALPLICAILLGVIPLLDALTLPSTVTLETLAIPTVVTLPLDAHQLSFHLDLATCALTLLAPRLTA